MPTLSKEKLDEAEEIRQEEFRKRFVISPKAGEQWQSIVQGSIDTRIHGAKSAMDLRISHRSAIGLNETPKSRHPTIISVK